MKIALFGGSFNPVHNAHIQVADKIIKNKITDEVWFMPCGNHAFGKELAPGKDRINMLNLAIGNNPKLKISDIEINSKKKNYTSETIKKIRKQFNHEFYFVIGTDNLESINEWENFDYLKENVEFILAKRPDYEIPKNLEIKIKNLLQITSKISSTQIRNNLKGKISIRNLVPEKVEEYIFERGLYK